MDTIKLYDINDKFNVFLPMNQTESDVFVFVCKSKHFKERKSARVLLTEEVNRCLLKPERGFSYSEADWRYIKDSIAEHRDIIVDEWEKTNGTATFIT